MRNSTPVNHENEELMNEILWQMFNIYGKRLSPFVVARFVGVLLVLKKYRLLKSIDCNNPHLIFEKIDLSDIPESISSFYSDVIVETSNSTTLVEFGHILNFIAMAEFGEGEFLHWYDYFLNELFNKSKFSNEFISPETFAVLVDAFLPSETKSVFNPFGGMMRLATDMERYQEIYACEINHNVWSIGLLRYELSNKAQKLTFENSDARFWTSGTFDAIVTMPPFNLKMGMHSLSALSGKYTFEDAELIAPIRFAETTNYNGCCITFVPTSILWSAGSRSLFREWATKNRYIDTIILLPKGLLSTTNIPVAFVVLRKNSYHEEGIRMIDASEFFVNHNNKNALEIAKIMEAYHHDIKEISATIPFEQIEENGWSWDIMQYLREAKVECPNGYTLTRIEDIVTLPQLARSKDKNSGKVVRIANLSDDWTNPYIDSTAIEKETTLYGCYVVAEDAILLSTFHTLKPTIVKASNENPVYVDNKILVVIPHSNIDAEYLCMVLSKAEIPTVSYATPYISKTRLLRHQIAIPSSLEQQRATYKESRSAAITEKIKTLHLEDAFNLAKEGFLNEVRSRKHDMMPHLSQLSSACENLVYYLAHRDSFSDSEFMSGMNEEVCNQKKAIESLSILLKIFSREDKFGTPEVVNIEQFLISRYMDGFNYEVDHNTDYQALLNCGFEIPVHLMNPSYKIIDGKVIFQKTEKDYADGLNVFIAKDDLQRLFDNIVNNAIQHGFTDSSRNDYNITTRLSVNPELQMFQIDVVNNGTPLPKGLDKWRYGIKGEKAGPKAGTGEGGYIVKSIVEHYKGEYDIFPTETNNGVQTTVRILLPIYRDNE